MRGSLKSRKTGWLAVSAVCLALAVFPIGWEIRKESVNQQEGIYRGHMLGEESLPLEEGVSYYPYQWALKNNGNVQRVVSATSAGWGTGGGISVRQETAGMVMGPGAGKGKESSESSRTEKNRMAEGIPAGPDGRKASEQQITRETAQQQVTDSVAGVDIEIEKAWQVYKERPERRQVVVAMIDTGVDTSHPELQNAVWVNSGEIPGDGIDNDGNGYIDDINGWNFYSGSAQIFTGAEDEHGTHGAGTIAAAWDNQGVSGIADSDYVKIMVLKVLGTKDGRGVSSGVKEAIRYAQDNGAQICNLSMGTLTYDGELERIIRNSPMLFVVSSGNGDAMGKGYDIDDLPMYPASFTATNVIAAGNLMFDGTLDESSNYGAVSVDLAAPGTYILNAVPNGYAFMSGTSMAAPMVTGTAALVYSCRTDLDLAGVREAILNSVRQMETLKGKVATGGMLDAYGAITYKR